MEPLIPVEVIITPDSNGVQSLVRQIRISGRAFPLFEVAGLVIQKPDRYDVALRVQKGKDGKPLQPLFACSLDDTLWLSEAEAARHILAKHFDTFYETNKIPCDPPKGTYTFVAQCGMSGEVLGPPNYHGYQDRLRELHAQRYRRMPFEGYKARVRIVKDEEVVKQWIESQSFKFEFTALNVPDPITFDSKEAVEKHFNDTHLPNLVKAIEMQGIPKESIPLLPAPLQTLLRVTMDKERRFPLRTATALSTAFAQSGLQFFKRDKTIVHVSIARPHFLDLENQVVSEGVKRILAFLETTEKPTRKKLVEALAPLPADSAPKAEATPAPAPAAAPAAAPAPSTEGASESGPANAEGVAASDAATPAPVPAPAAEAPATPPAPETTPERSALLTDLHWLIHQGHVIEFANGIMELAKRPFPVKSGNAGGGQKSAPAGGSSGPRAKGQRREPVPWTRKRGLLLVDSHGIQPYGVSAALVGL
jgi:hypothetical protein